MSRGRRALVFVVIFFATVAVDQGSKVWARTLPVGQPQAVIDGYWDWELGYNPGIAFSTFTHATPVILSLIAAAALVGIGVTAARTRPEERLKRVALAMIAGGALGNLIDRARDGVVTDFVRWRIGEHRWPIFNVADAALLIGVALLLVESALAHRRRARPA